MIKWQICLVMSDDQALFQPPTNLTINVNLLLTYYVNF